MLGVTLAGILSGYGAVSTPHGYLTLFVHHVRSGQRRKVAVCAESIPLIRALLSSLQ